MAVRTDRALAECITARDLFIFFSSPRPLRVSIQIVALCYYLLLSCIVVVLCDNGNDDITHNVIITAGRYDTPCGYSIYVICTRRVLITSDYDNSVSPCRIAFRQQLLQSAHNIIIVCTYVL